RAYPPVPTPRAYPPVPTPPQTTAQAFGTWGSHGGLPLQENETALRRQGALWAMETGGWCLFAGFTETVRSFTGKTRFQYDRPF
ncbi:hypothetical protein QUA00_24690, partial [Microcoleus sp. T2B6]|uniref:hypothetical protein n=1 Tax=Microcoleus sp. T2B6 TaxID=3055424 RepID=UPI002FCEFDF4